MHLVLALEPYAGRMVGTVDIGVAICTTLAEYIAAIQIPTIPEATWVSTTQLVALEAQEWRSDLQHTRLCRAVRIMTDCAVLLDRLVFPQERPAFLLVTLVTHLVNRVLCQVCRPGGAMWIMAIRTDHLAFPDGVA